MAITIRPTPDAALVAAFLNGRTANTAHAYGRDLAHFAAFLGTPDVDAAAAVLLSGTHGEANARVLAYRAHMQDAGLASNTTARRLAAVRSLVKLARTLGLVPWALEVRSPRTKAHRDTRGPGRRGYQRILAAVAERGDDEKARRDRAIVRLLYDMALRREEVASLDYPEHVDGAGARLSVRGKGDTGRVWLTIPDETMDALRAWLEARGEAAGPVFYALDGRGRGKRLSGRSIARNVVGELGRRAGIVARPHGLRHAAITEALNLTNGDVRAVQRFSRHAKVTTVTLYDDNRADTGGDIAKLVAKAAAV
jgi:integrase/recombinase XerC